MMPYRQRPKRIVNWYPLGGSDAGEFNALAAGATATRMIPLQDPVTSENLQGTILSALLDVTLFDAAGVSLKQAPAVGLWKLPAGVGPFQMTNAALKENEEFFWYQGTMTAQPGAIGSPSALWAFNAHITTKRKITKGNRLGLSILNKDLVSALGAAPKVGYTVEIYMGPAD